MVVSISKMIALTLPKVGSKVTFVHVGKDVKEEKYDDISQS